MTTKTIKIHASKDGFQSRYEYPPFDRISSKNETVVLTKDDRELTLVFGIGGTDMSIAHQEMYDFLFYKED